MGVVVPNEDNLREWAKLNRITVRVVDFCLLLLRDTLIRALVPFSLRVFSAAFVWAALARLLTLLCSTQVSGQGLAPLLQNPAVMPLIFNDMAAVAKANKASIPCLHAFHAPVGPCPACLADHSRMPFSCSSSLRLVRVALRAAGRLRAGQGDPPQSRALLGAEQHPHPDLQGLSVFLPCPRGACARACAVHLCFSCVIAALGTVTLCARARAVLRPCDSWLLLVRRSQSITSLLRLVIAAQARLRPQGV